MCELEFLHRVVEFFLALFGDEAGRFDLREHLLMLAVEIFRKGRFDLANP